jgi:hypothetical protein
MRSKQRKRNLLYLLKSSLEKQQMRLIVPRKKKSKRNKMIRLLLQETLLLFNLCLKLPQAKQVAKVKKWNLNIDIQQDLENLKKLRAQTNSEPPQRQVMKTLKTSLPIVLTEALMMTTKKRVKRNEKQNRRPWPTNKQERVAHPLMPMLKNKKENQWECLGRPTPVMRQT